MKVNHDISEIILDKDWCQEFTVLTSFMTVNEYGRSITERIENTFEGVIYPSNTEDLDMLPAGIKTTGNITIFCRKPLILSTDITKSDIVKYNGGFYTVMAIEHFEDYGYYKAIAVKSFIQAIFPPKDDASADGEENE